MGGSLAAACGTASCSFLKKPPRKPGHRGTTRLVVPAAVRGRIATPHADAIVAGLAPLDHESGIGMPDVDFVFLCFTNRCGSNYLAALLASTGALNDAGEVFLANVVLNHARTRGLGSLRGYMVHLPLLVPMVGRRMAVKTSIDQLIMLADAGILDALLPRARFILLERRDRLGQAISRSIAGQTGRWTSAQSSRITPAELQYSRAAIETEMAHVDLANHAFYAFFAANGIVPLHLVYEDVVADPQGAVDQAGRYLGIEGPVANPARIGISRQADAVNAAWRARYEAGR